MRRIKPFLIIQNKGDNFINSNKQTKSTEAIFHGCFLLVSGAFSDKAETTNDRSFHQIFFQLCNIKKCIVIQTQWSMDVREYLLQMW